MKPTVVVGYDRTPSSERALVEAGREAAWRGARVLVVHAFHWIPAATPSVYAPLRLEQSLKSAADEIADTGVQTLRGHYPGMQVESRVIAGPTADVLTEAARDADLLVVGNRGRGGFASLMLGSVSLRALSYASCPTMVVRGGERSPLDTVVAAIDVEDPADELLEFAFAEASQRDAHLKALCAWDLSWMTQYTGDTPAFRRASDQSVSEIDKTLRRLVRPWQAKYPDVRADTVIADGTPAEVLTTAAEHADLIVAGAHRRGDGHPGLRPGPIAHMLLHHADCPVAIVPRS